MSKVMIRLGTPVSHEMVSAFPHLTSRQHGGSTMLTGSVADQEELLGVLNLLSTMGIEVVEVLTIPED